MKKKIGGWLAAALLAVGCTAMTASAFTDTTGHWAEESINKWSGEYGIIQGYDDGTFRPDNSITRGAFAGILDRFLHFQEVSPADTFSDTPGTYWEDAILKLHAAGVYLGNEGEALSNSTITRQQAVAMIGGRSALRRRPFRSAMRMQHRLRSMRPPMFRNLRPGAISRILPMAASGRQSLSPGRKSSTSLETWSIRW